MRRSIALCAGVAILAGLILATGARATPAQQAAGFAEFEATISERTAGPNLVTHIHADGVWTGTFSGNTVGDFDEVVRISGDSRIHGKVTCTCTVEGRRGTVVFANVLAASLDPVTFGLRLSGRAVATGATGELTGLHAVLDFVLDPATFVTTYTGSYHFD